MSRRHRRRLWDEAALVREFDLYDRGVDIVSAFEFWFTSVASVVPTVAHFERYPRLKHRDGRSATPDFTVLFTDSTGIVGEIANLPLEDRGVDKLCAQLMRYDSLAALPSGNAGRVEPIRTVDVLYLTPAETGPQAIDRIMRDRLRARDHPFKPGRPPTVMQFFRSPERLLAQRIPDSANGKLCVGDRRGPSNFRNWTNYNLLPERFTPIKVARGFINDPVPPLYMATVLMLKVWPSLYGGVRREFQTSVAETTDALHAQYKVGRSNEVRSALDLLESAGLAKPAAADGWTVTRRQARGEEKDLHKVIARAAASRGPSTAGLAPHRRQPIFKRPGPGQDSLF